MSLQNLVTLKYQLTKSLKVDHIVDDILKLKNSIELVKQSVPNIDEEHEAYLTNLVEHYTQVVTTISKPVADLKNYLRFVDKEINIYSQKLYGSNYQLEEKYGSPDDIRNYRQVFIADDVKSVVTQRILLHTDWKYPALEIGCRDGEWTKHLVAADPLYIVDRHREFLTSAAEQFPEEYQRRLRAYYLDKHNLLMLPRNQFGFIFSWSYFNYVGMDTIKQYLQQMFLLLRPGGVCMFSYNNGETPVGASLAENLFQAYMPRSILESLAQSLGFEIYQATDLDGGTSWIELKKPGVLNTIKTHQVLGEILPRNISPLG